MKSPESVFSPESYSTDGTQNLDLCLSDDTISERGPTPLSTVSERSIEIDQARKNDNNSVTPTATTSTTTHNSQVNVQPKLLSYKPCYTDHPNFEPMKNSFKSIFTLFPNHKEIIEAYIGICLHEGGIIPAPNETDIAELIGVIVGNGYESTAEFLLAMGALSINPDQEAIKTWMEDSCDCDGEETISELLIKVVQLLNKNDTTALMEGSTLGPNEGPEVPGLSMEGPASPKSGPPVEVDKIQDTPPQKMDDAKSENEIIERNNTTEPSNNVERSPITSSTMPVNNPNKTAKDFSKEERKAIVAQVTEELISPTELSRRHGISISAIRGWVKTAGKRFPSRYKTTATATPTPKPATPNL